MDPAFNLTYSSMDSKGESSSSYLPRSFSEDSLNSTVMQVPDTPNSTTSPPRQWRPFCSTATKSGVNALFPETSVSAIACASIRLDQVDCKSLPHKNRELPAIPENDKSAPDNSISPSTGRALVGVYFYVTKKCEEMFNELQFSLASMGAEILTDISDCRLTHIISYGKLLREKGIKSAISRNPQIHLVSPSWVWICQEKQIWVSEKSYGCEHYDYFADMQNLHRRSSLPPLAVKRVTRSAKANPTTSESASSSQKEVPRLNNSVTPPGNTDLRNKHLPILDFEVPVRPQTPPDEDNEENVDPELPSLLPMFLFAGLPDDIKTSYTVIIQNLGGILIDSPKFAWGVDIVLASSLIRTEKILCSIAAGKFIVHQEYLIDSERNGAFLNPNNYLWHDRGGKVGTTNHLAVGYKFWFEQIKANPNNKPFAKFRAIIFEDDELKGRTYHDLIVAGGGIVLEKEAISFSCDANIIICESKASLEALFITKSLRRIVVKSPIVLYQILTECKICGDEYFNVK